MEFVAHIRNSPDLLSLYDSVQSDSSLSGAADIPMNVE